MHFMALTAIVSNIKQVFVRLRGGDVHITFM